MYSIVNILYNKTYKSKNFIKNHIIKFFRRNKLHKIFSSIVYMHIYIYKYAYKSAKECIWPELANPLKDQEEKEYNYLKSIIIQQENTEKYRKNRLRPRRL